MKTTTIFLLALFLSVCAAESPLIISKTDANGTVWINPDANVGVQNTACTDTYGRLKQVCDSFCGAEAKSVYAAEWNYHDYMYGHYDLRNYPVIWQAYEPNRLMSYNLKRSKFYKERYAACKLCSGLGEVKPVWVVG